MKTTFKLTAVLVLCLGGLVFAGSIDTPIAHWTFDEMSGTTLHDSAGTNHGTIYGAAWTTGIIGGALNFDGINDYVNCGNGASLDSMAAITLSAWIYVDEWKLGEAARIISKRYHPYNSYELGIDTSLGYPNIAAVYYCQNGNSNTHSPQGSISLNKWMHIAATNTGTQQKIYVDGQQVASYNINSGPIRDTDINLWIGRVSGGYVSSAFDGLIDDVRIYDYALSDSDVSHLYQIPEPASLLILGAGLLRLRGKRRR